MKIILSLVALYYLIKGSNVDKIILHQIKNTPEFKKYCITDFIMQCLLFFGISTKYWFIFALLFVFSFIYFNQLRFIKYQQYLISGVLVITIILL